MNPERSEIKSIHNQENDQAIQIDLIDPEARDDIAAYYQFEIDQGFSELDPKTLIAKTHWIVTL